VTPAEIIYQRRIAVLEHAQPDGQCGRDLPGLRHLSDPLLRVEGRGRPLRPRCPDAQGPRRAPQMPEATPTHVVEALLTLAVLEPTIGCRQYADRLGDQGFCHRQVDRAKAPGGPRPGQTAFGAPGPGGGHRRGDDRVGDRGGQGGRALRVLPGHGGSGRAGLRGQLLHRQAQGGGQGVPAHRHRRLHPLGLRRHRAWARSMAPTPRASSTSCSATIGATESGSEPCSATTGPNTWPAPLSRPWPPRDCATIGFRPARPTTTPSVSAFTRPSSKSAGGRPSIAGASPRSASSKPKRTPGSSPITTAGATTATTCAAGRLIRSSTTTRETRQHDHHQPQRPSVTSTPGPEELGDCERGRVGRR
jgi:hypothetical protein